MAYGLMGMTLVSHTDMNGIGTYGNDRFFMKVFLIHHLLNTDGILIWTEYGHIEPQFKGDLSPLIWYEKLCPYMG